MLSPRIMIDTHTHLYLDAFENDLDDVIKRAENVGVKKMYLPAIDSSTHEAMLAMEALYPSQCFAMIGLHPCSVKADYVKELAIIEGQLEQRSFAAIGETGLDFYWDTSFVEEQILALEQQIKWAVQYNIPLILHTRNATPETISIIEKFKQPALRGIFHCFSGSLKEAQQIIACNFLLGIGGVVTYKNGGLDAVLPAIDLQHVVLETDAPYLAPVPYRGKRNECSYLPAIAQRIADIKGIDIQVVLEQTTLNAEKIFSRG